MRSGIEWTSGIARLDVSREFSAGANASFPRGWGDDRLFRWAFLEPRAGRTGMLIMARRGASALAGSGLTFRMVDNGDQPFLAAVMTGSWTHPDARGEGLFSEMIQQSITLAHAAGAQLLLAFVTQDNASRHRLEAAGAVLFPSAYCLGPLAAPLSAGALREGDLWPRRGARAGVATFAYSDEEWRRQFMERPTASKVVVIGDHTGTAVVEQADRNHIVHALSAPHEGPFLSTLVGAAALDQRRLFCFTTRDSLREELARMGFEITLGSVAVIATGRQSVAPRVQGWDLVNGDRL